MGARFQCDVATSAFQGAGSGAGADAGAGAGAGSTHGSNVDTTGAGTVQPEALESPDDVPSRVMQRSQVRHRAAARSQHGARPEDSSDDDGDVDEELRADLSPPELSDYFELWVAIAAWLSVVY